MSDCAPVEVVTLPLPRSFGVNIQPLQTHAICGQRVTLDAAFSLIALAFTANLADEIAGAAQRRSDLQNVRCLREIDVRRHVQVISQRAPIIQDALQVRFGDRRAQRQIRNLGTSFIDAPLHIKVDAVNWSSVIDKRRIRRAHGEGIHAAARGIVRIVRLDRRTQVARFP